MALDDARSELEARVYSRAGADDVPRDESHLVDSKSTLVSQAYRESVRPPVDIPSTDMFREQLDEFALAIRGEAEVEVGALEAIRALAVVHAALESSQRNGQAVAVAPMVEKAGALQ